MTNGTAKASKDMRITTVTTDSLNTESLTELVCTLGQMGKFMTGSGAKVSSRDMASGEVC